MSRLDHVNIVRAITYCQSLDMRVLGPNHEDYFSLLFWTDSARKNYLCLDYQLQELFL